MKAKVTELRFKQIWQLIINESNRSMLRLRVKQFIKASLNALHIKI